MSKRNQPYLPLYVQDFLTDEKLMECSASATGIYIRIMCIMHKSEQYGQILLKQKYKQRDNVFQNFALYLMRFMPYCIDEIAIGLGELVSADVLQLDGDVLSQKRMIKDNKLSTMRSQSGQKGGKNSLGKKNKPLFEDDIDADFAQAKPKANAQANIKANYENENENEIEDEVDKVNKKITAKEKTWNKTKKAFLNNTKWKENFAFVKEITLPMLEKEMANFIQMIELSTDYKNVQELRRHFLFYYNKIKQNETNKRTNQKPKFGNAVREAGDRMGSIGNTIGKEIA